MRIVDVKTMRYLEHFAIQESRIPARTLMKRAAQGIKDRMDVLQMREKRILILCGPGNNGGDGFALATLLHQDAYHAITLVCRAPFAAMAKDVAFYAKMANACGIAIHQDMTIKSLQVLLACHDVVVDALFGIGLSRDITGVYAQCIQCINEAKRYVISVDIASGIDADTGCVKAQAIRADETITFACRKQGQLLYPGSMHSGSVHVVDIGIPLKAYQNVTYSTVLDDEIAHALLPKRQAHSHKGSYGKVLLIGGSLRMHGALTLCAKSMLRSGVGMLTLFVPETIAMLQAYKVEECMLLPAPAKDGFFAQEANACLQQHMHAYDMFVIGNGMGRSAACEALVCSVLQSDRPCILDGDALYLCAHHMDLLQKRTAPTILTPHPKEMSYLTGKLVQDIVSQPFHIAALFAKEYPHVVLALKDQYTIVAHQLCTYVNIAGNNALAKGGSGDVLCGIIAGLFAQGKDGIGAAATGVYVHACCGDEACTQSDANSILPSDLLLYVGAIFKRIRATSLPCSDS